MKGRRRYKKICISINLADFKESLDLDDICHHVDAHSSGDRRLEGCWQRCIWFHAGASSSAQESPVLLYISYSDMCMASMFVQKYIILVADSIRGREGGIARHHVSVFLQSAHALHAMKPFSSMQASYMQTRKAQQHPPLFRTENKKDCSKLLV